MNNKVRIISSHKVIEDGLKTEFIIPESNFWKVFKSYGTIKTIKRKKKEKN